MEYKTKKETQAERYEPPHSTEAEHDVLGAILKDPDAINAVVDFFNSEEYFYEPRHRTIFRAILNLYDRKEPTDVTTISEELTRMNELEKVGGRLYLIDLIEGVASTANISAYAEIVIEKAFLRKLINVLNSMLKDCFNMGDTVGDLLDRAEQKIFAIQEGRLREGFVSLRELLPHSFEQVENYQETKGGLAGLSTGFEALDSLTAGLHAANFVVVAGRPSMGKTALALNIAEYVAVEKKKAVGMFSIEMSKEQLALRMLCGRARISQHKLRTGRLKDKEWSRLTIASGPLSEAQIFIDDSAVLSTLEMRAKARRLKSQHDIGLLVIDYIQMMHGSGRAENRQQEMAMISRSIKGLSKELDIPVLAVSQLSRQVEMRGGDRRPQLSDLRESGAIEQDADVVMFVYRPEFYLSHLDPDDPKLVESRGRAEILVAKQRNGPTGKVELTFVKDYVRFENPAKGFTPESSPAYSEPDSDTDIPF
jgi:replicative DNA helicase